MTINSKQKGKRGELEAASKLREYGYPARRTAQYCGNTGDASDIVGLPGLHLEVKRTEKFNLYDALSQAKRDAKSGLIPVVLHRRNDCEWVAVLELGDFMAIYTEWEASNG
jgi:hypothetical protein